MASGAKFCVGCGSFLTEPFVSCAECRWPAVRLCLACFARGVESGRHENNHSYEVVKDDFSLLEKKWTAREELRLLEAISDCGLGNWSEVAMQMPHKTKQECEAHYMRCYIDHPPSPLPEMPEPDRRYALFPMPISHKATEDPPRPMLDSQLYNDMAGYMAARSDFATEYDNYAEHDICQMQFTADDDERDTHLKVAVLRIYNRRLRERARRKRILRCYGLINTRKAALCFRRYDGTLGRRVSEGLVSFMHLLKPMEFDLLLESLHYEQELRQRIRLLQEFRSSGLTRFHSTQLYGRLKVRREERRHQQRVLDNVLDHVQNKMACHQWLQRQMVGDSKPAGAYLHVSPNIHRRPAPPLDIAGLPGYEKLNPRERELCSLVRLVPEAFLEFKSILVGECQKLGSLRLAQARTLIKIDVNKTRKLFDFLVGEGCINKDPLPK